jgi:hypothetical protein
MFILLGLRLSSAIKDHALQCEDGPYASADASKHHKLHFTVQCAYDDVATI